MNILDLDRLKTINNYVSINTNYRLYTIYTLIVLIKTYGTIINQACYKLHIKYLGHILPMIYEFDHTSQFLDMKYYAGDNKSECNLHLVMTSNDDPMIKWIKADCNVPSYTNSKVNLGKGEYLMNFAHCFLSFVGFKRSRLDDDSYFFIGDNACPDFKLKLWLYLILTKGTSWYHKFGYVPSNVALNEYQYLIENFKSIKLSKIISELPSLKTIIDNPKQTLEEYVKSHQLEQVAVLFNIIFQSKFATHFWYQTYNKLFLANICQTNDAINNFVRLDDN
jgi:hypothetical protein